MITLTQKLKYPVMFLILFAFIFCCAGVSLAEMVEVNAGMQAADKEALADQIKKIIQGLGYFIGVIAVGVLIFNGFRLATATNEQKRLEVKTHIAWTLGAVVLVALAMMIVGYVISLVGGDVDVTPGMILMPFIF